MSTTEICQHAINLFFDYLKGQNKAPLTLKNYRTDITAFFKWIKPDTRLNDIDEQTIRKFIAYSLTGQGGHELREHEPTTCNRRLATLKKFFDWLKYTKRTEIDPTKAVPFLPVKRKLVLYLSQEQVSRLLHYAKMNSLLDYTIVHTLYFAALRVSELCNMEKSAVDFDNGRLLVHGKRGRDRNVPVLPHDLKPLKAFAKAHHHLYVFDRFFCSPQHKPLQPRYIQLMISDTAKAAGFHCYPHLLRHSRATHLIQSGVDIYYLKSILGHSTVSTTEIYAHVDDEHLRDALARASRYIRVA